MSSGHDSQRGAAASTSTHSNEQDGRTGGIGAMAGEAASKISDATQQVSRQAKQTATSLASEGSTKIKGLMNEQVGAGADLVGHVAESVRRAADDLDRNIPQLAGFARDGADRIEEFSDQIRDKSVDELYRNAADFARRQPALVFGATAALGFLMFRLIKGMPSAGSGDGGAQQFGEDRWAGEWPGDERWRAGEMSGGSQASPTSRQTNPAGQFHGV